MTASLTGQPPRGTALTAAIRGFLCAAALVTIYYLMPMRGSDAPVALSLVLGMVAFATLVVWQVAAIVKADYPGLRAAEALATAVPLFVLVFAAAYYTLDGGQSGTFTQPLDKTGALYFAVTVFSSVGLGDIAPVTQTARVIVMVQMLADLVVLGAVLKLLFNTAKLARERRSAAG